MMKWLFIPIILLDSCRNTPAPPIDICILAPAGGGNCQLKDGKQVFETPSQMENYVAIPAEDFKALLGFCYDTSPAHVSAKVDELVSKLK